MKSSKTYLNIRLCKTVEYLFSLVVLFLGCGKKSFNQRIINNEKTDTLNLERYNKVHRENIIELFKNYKK